MPEIERELRWDSETAWRLWQVAGQESSLPRYAKLRAEWQGGAACHGNIMLICMVIGMLYILEDAYF